MSWGGANAYKKPLISWGGRMRRASNSLEEPVWPNCYVSTVTM